MATSTNPYQPPQTIDADGGRLTFDGAIEEADYARLLLYRDSEWWLLSVLIVLLAICLAFFGCVVMTRSRFADISRFVNR